MEYTKAHNIKVEERLFTIEEALNAVMKRLWQVLLFLFLPIIEIDGKPIGTGKPGEMC